MSTWSAGDIPDLAGRSVIVTGASAGLGKATTRVLAGRGARVVMACRNEAKARLLPALVATPGARIVTVTSGAHRFGRIRLDDPSFDTGGYRALPAYAQSKLANLLFSAELGRRLRTAGHDTISAAAEPGFARTELGTKDSSRTQRAAVRISYLIIPSQSAGAGAGPILRAATDPAAASGQLYGPRLVTRGAPIEKKPSHRATRDPLVAARLWDLSLELVGMDTPAVLAPARARGNTA